MHVKCYDCKTFLIVIAAFLFEVFKTGEPNLYSFFWILFLTLVIFLANWPFCEYYIDERGIQALQLGKRYFFSWSEINTICIFSTIHCDALYASKLNIDEIEKLIAESKGKDPIKMIDRFYSVNPLIRMRCTKAQRLNGKFLQIREKKTWSMEKTEQFAQKILHYDLEYIIKNGGTIVTIFRYPKTLV